ncbi:MAG: hypothetical protein LBS60_13275 [Deltaproteobacteria bacterium]|jgi:hypothetical protein|nr:hypothetical protein [Deltaproteobacteria bacterium]
MNTDNNNNNDNDNDTNTDYFDLVLRNISKQYPVEFLKFLNIVDDETKSLIDISTGEILIDDYSLSTELTSLNIKKSLINAKLKFMNYAIKEEIKLKHDFKSQLKEINNKIAKNKAASKAENAKKDV